MMLLRLLRTVGLSLLLMLPSACTYLKYAEAQAEYVRIQEASPAQRNLRHLIDRQVFYVVGKTLDRDRRYVGVPMAIAAYSDKFEKSERVDTMQFFGLDTHFGLSLPDGDYQLIVFADLDKSGVFDRTEVVGELDIALDPDQFAEKVLTQLTIPLGQAHSTERMSGIPVRVRTEGRKSLFYPAGTIRSLDDPLFDERNATLGMYDPAAFLAQAPTLFYALEEDLSYKIPVVFVHGINGSPRSFQPLIEKLDLTRYKPWFFYYPSGGDLDHFAAFFYRLFLSGEVIRLGDMPMIVVAHSMGGLIVREALNKYRGAERENKVRLFVSIASPFAGHEAAASGEKHGILVLPAWRDLNPASPFINRLFRKPLPAFTRHHLLYAFEDARGIRFGSNSDGVVSLASQLREEVQQQSSLQLGINSGHTGVLASPRAIGRVLTSLDAVSIPLPPSHLALLHQGGYALHPEQKVSPLTAYYVQNIGRYLLALAAGEVEPISPPQKQFMAVVQGRRTAANVVERELLMWIESIGHPLLPAWSAIH